jgi:hypothetical protein
VILEASEMSGRGEVGNEQKVVGERKRGKEDFKRVWLMSSGTCLGFRHAVARDAGSE